MTDSARTFPDGFLWGAATAGHQVAGNNVGSDYWEWEHAPDNSFVEPSGDAVDYYHRWREDLVVAAVVEKGRRPRSRFADLLIAATAHANGLDLYTRNGSDFVGLEDLVRVINL
jgi:hypothetical protein